MVRPGTIRICGRRYKSQGHRWFRRTSRNEDVLLHEAKREAAEAARSARKASNEAARTRAEASGHSSETTPGAAERTADLVAESPSASERAAFLLDLRRKVAESTSTYQGWQQIPAWILGAAGIALALVLAFDDTSQAPAGLSTLQTQ